MIERLGGGDGGGVGCGSERLVDDGAECTRADGERCGVCSDGGGVAGAIGAIHVGRGQVRQLAIGTGANALMNSRLLMRVSRMFGSMGRRKKDSRPLWHHSNCKGGAWFVVILGALGFRLLAVSQLSLESRSCRI